ncbi:MAG: hypothetical protein ACOZDY_04690 [Pseudomonadota bacterium]
MLNRGLELLAMLKEDLGRLGAEDLHQLQRARRSRLSATIPL